MKTNVPPLEPQYLIGGARGRRYVVAGEWWRVAGSLGFQQGVRDRIIRLVLRAQSTLGVGRTDLPPSSSAAWRQLSAALPNMTAALLYFTGFYKPVELLGMVLLDDRERGFVKVWGREEDAVRAAALHRAGVQWFSPWARVPKLNVEVGCVHVYECIYPARRARSLAEVQSLAADWSVALWQVGSRPDLGGWAPKLERAPLLELGLPEPLIQELEEVEIVEGGERVLAHGDMTPWNVLVDSAGGRWLVDFERMSNGPPFADCFHCVVQSAAFGWRADESELVPWVRSISGASEDSVRTWYRSYLIDQLRVDLTEWSILGRRHPELHRLIEYRKYLLTRCSRTGA